MIDDFDLPKDPEEEALMEQRMLEEAVKKELAEAERVYAKLLKVEIVLDLSPYNIPL
jgi:hypothetical protein